MRSAPEAPPDAVLVLRTLGAPERRRLRGRRGRRTEQAEPEPVPTARATVVRAEPFSSPEQAERWLAGLRDDIDAAGEELERATVVVNRALHAHRVAAADAALVELTRRRALAARVGYGAGDEVAEGRFADAWEPPERGGRRAKRSMAAPEERFAAILGGRDRALVSEGLVLRVRADLDAGRLREAALQARVALEALLAELPGGVSAGLAEERGAVGSAANAALRGELGASEAAAVERVAEAMEQALRRGRPPCPGA